MSSISFSFCRWASTGTGASASNMSPTNLYTCANGMSSGDNGSSICCWSSTTPIADASLALPPPPPPPPAQSMLVPLKLLDLEEVLLRVAPYLDCRLGADMLLDLLPVASKHEQRVDEAGVLLGAPPLAGLGDGVGLPRLLPGHLAAPAVRGRVIPLHGPAQLSSADA
uniref:Uncharacterized protein n=1 Tax=Zea mays TaxID=4577 RepID=C0PM11_MAIZE|nr:unknown [Zea mays]|eukprot:NP_001170206.1 uncharacterized protein LOC100384156 [Zea mays]